MKKLNSILTNNLKNMELDCNSCNSKSKDEIEKCPVCGQDLQKIIYIPALKRNMKVPVMCKCREEELKAKEKRDKDLQRQIRLQQIFKNSLMDNKFIDDKFENWDQTKGSKKIYRVAKAYAENFSKMKQNGIGLMFQGEPGNGKTFAATCIANFLMSKMIPVICVNINNLLDRIMTTYNTYQRELEDDVIRGLNNAELLIIDDLGTEQYTDWAKTKIYKIIDSRYRSKLPIIITTNFTTAQLRDKYGERTMDRIIEICTPVLNDIKSIRMKQAKENMKILKEINLA